MLLTKASRCTAISPSSFNSTGASRRDDAPPKAAPAGRPGFEQRWTFNLSVRQPFRPDLPCPAHLADKSAPREPIPTRMLWQINVHEIVEVVLIFNAPSTRAGRQPRSAELIMSLRHFRADDVADLSTDDVPLCFIPPTDHNM